VSWARGGNGRRQRGQNRNAGRKEGKEKEKDYEESGKRRSKEGNYPFNF
jgi:hypothetical protein